MELLVLDNETRNDLTMCKQIRSGSFKNNVTNKLFANKLYKQDVALNKPQGLICHKTQRQKTIMKL